LVLILQLRRGRLELDLKQFLYVCDILPDQENGNINEFSPQSRYHNKKGLELHNYGNGSFCKFKIPNDYQKAGVYIIVVDGLPKYVGESENLSTRFNAGYGNISPRNCYTPRGQQTNCRINRLILESIKKGNKIKLLFQETNNRVRLEEQLIQEINPEWNRTQGTKRPPRRKNQDIRISNSSESKYYKLQKYLQDSTKTEELLKYSEIEDILGFELPRSAYEYKAWWSNGSHTQANAWLDAGWKVKSVKLTESVTFIKIPRNFGTVVMGGKKK